MVLQSGIDGILISLWAEYILIVCVSPRQCDRAIGDREREKEQSDERHAHEILSKPLLGPYTVGHLHMYNFRT